MDSKTKSILLGAIVLLILAAVSGTALYLGKFSRVKVSSEQENKSASLSKLQVAPTGPATSLPKTSNNSQPSNIKTYQGDGFKVNYPTQWGILTCNNSQNFELDPTSNTDIKNTGCNFAVKPVTVLVADKLNCTGETVKLGNVSAVKSKAVDQSGTDYRWCVGVGNKSLDITHRVSATGSQATSKEDFSTQVEDIIKNIQFAGSGAS